MEVHPYDICWIFITFESFALDTIAPLRSSPSRTLGPTEIVLLRELIQCWLEKERQELLPLHLGLLLGRLSKIGSSRKRSTASPVGTDVNLLTRVNRYILARLDRPFGLKELACAIGQSESHLRGRFRAATGYSIGRHIRHLRIQQACNLLHTTGLTVGEVGEKCGFESVYSFSRTFKTERGVSPRDYRQGVYSPKN
ncbi:MAG: helix-turn-helix domain-containing protein [Chthoniobacteraceae bacterium]